VQVVVDRREFERWRAEAGQACRQAEISAAAGLHNWASFSAEQAAQLAVKGLLHALGQAPWGHDLVALGDAAAAAGLVLPDAARQALRRLSRHYMAARYPDTLPGGAPSDRYAREDAEQALADLSVVLELVDEAWRELGD
jgi:HEPN domain-containing protein